MDNDTIDPIDTELRGVLHGMIATPDVEFDDVVAGVQNRVVRRRRNRRVLTAASLVSVVVVATAAGVVITNDPHTKQHVNVTASSTVPARAPIVTDADGVESFGPIPLKTRSGTANVWTGSELVVWGGSIESANAGLPGPDLQFNDGAAFDPASQKWRRLSPSPLPASRGTSFGVATDAGVVFTSGRATALWNPTGNSWRLLGEAPAAVEDLWFTGTSVISVSAHGSLDPATGVWHAIAPLPNLDRKAVVWTGEELFVIGGPGTAFTSAVAYAYTPAANAWRRLADPPAELHAEALAADWDGKRIVVVNYDMQAHAYDPATNTWKVLPSVPARFSEWSPTLGSSGGNSVVFMADTVAVLKAADEWTPLPYDPIPAIGQVVSAGDRAVFVIGWPRGEKVNVLTAIDLERLVDNATRIQVGIASVAIPRGFELTAANFETAGIGAETVRVRLEGPHGEVCLISSAYGGGETVSIADPIREVLVNGGQTTPWDRDESGETWTHSPDGSDSFAVVCNDATLARAVATSASPVFG